MKLLVVGSNLDKCEAHMVAHFSRSGLSVTAVLEPNQPHEPLLVGAGVSLIPLTIKSRISLNAISKIKGILNQDSFDLMHCFSSNALSNALFASRGEKIKCVAYRGTSGHLSRLDPTSWLTFFHPRLDKIICVSKAVERYFLEKRVSQKKLVAIYKGHDISWYQNPVSIDLAEFGVPKNVFVVGCVANMRPVKGVPVLIEAFRNIDSHLPIHLVLVGDIRDDAVKTLLSDPVFQGRIHLTGYRKDAPAVIAKANVFVMPSIKREGLPKALIEAMSQGVAPVVSDVGGMPEVVRHQKDGLVVPPSNPKLLAEAILHLYNNPHDKMTYAHSAQQRIAKDFKIETTVEQTLKVYSELVGHRV